MELFLDTETWSEVPIARGVDRYAEGSAILLTSWAIDDEPARVAEGWPDEVAVAVDVADRIIIHNSRFDRVVLKGAEGAVIPQDRIHDTMAQARSVGLPGGLGQLCSILGVDDDKAKDKEGRALIHLFCKPRPKNMALRRATKDTHPEEWRRFREYARRDIEAMREVYRKLPGWNYQGAEYDLWLLDQKINDRGFAVDLDLANGAIAAAAKAKRRLDRRTAKITDGEVESTTQRDALLKHLLEQHGVDLPDMQKGTIERRVNDENLPGAVRELLAIRLDASATSVAKYRRLAEATGADGRLRGALEFCGAARTGRWSGRLFQPQNLPRPSHSNEEIEATIDAVKEGVADLVFDDVIPRCVSAVRGAIIAPEGKKLLVADLANIEGRVLAWLAGEEWKIDAFRAYDAGDGPDLYKIAYARSFGVKLDDVGKDERQVGKVMELACLAAGTSVLTDSGPKKIESVSRKDRVWDGEEYVEHDGLLCRGEKIVGEYQGLTATPDHLVFVEGQHEPIPFEQAAARGARIVQSGAGGTPLRVGRDTFQRAPLPAKMAVALRRGTLRRLWARAVDRLVASAKWQVARVPILFAAPTCAEVAGEALYGREATMHKSESEAVCRLRRARDHVRFSLADRNGRVDRRELGCSKREAARSHRQRQRLRARQPALGYSERKRSKLSNLRRAATYDLRNAGPRHRFTANGRLVHNCGYQGAVGAFRSMSALYGVDLPEPEVLRIVKAWRKAHTETVDLWYGCERKAIDAVQSPGVTLAYGKLKFRRDGAWLRLGLPSGRVLCYPSPTIEDGDRGRPQLTYMGINQYSRKWERIRTYGGKLVENATQATARDVLAHGMMRAEEAGLPVVLSVHDEIIAEVDADGPDADALVDAMTTLPAWAEGLPLAAEGEAMRRYRK